MEEGRERIWNAIGGERMDGGKFNQGRPDRNFDGISRYSFGIGWIKFRVSSGDRMHCFRQGNRRGMSHVGTRDMSRVGENNFLQTFVGTGVLEREENTDGRKVDDRGSLANRVGGGGRGIRKTTRRVNRQPGNYRFRLVGLSSLFHEIQLEFQEIGRWRYAHRNPLSYLRERCGQQASYSRWSWTVAVAYNPRIRNEIRNTEERKGRRRADSNGVRDIETNDQGESEMAGKHRKRK